jgi:glutathione S-transferase
MAIELVSAKECPFVQRAVILLKEKQVPHTVKYIDLAKKPEWFLSQSPRGKVPILNVDGTTLFESQAICEYLDETQGDTRLAPSDALQRARDRAWFSFASDDLLVPQYMLMVADDSAKYEAKRDQLLGRLARLDQEKPGDWLSGDGSRFGLADVAIAPLFTRFAFLTRLNGYSWLNAYPRLQAWSDALLARPSVKDSVTDDFDKVVFEMLTRRNAWVLRGVAGEGT